MRKAKPISPDEDYTYNFRLSVNNQNEKRIINALADSQFEFKYGTIKQFMINALLAYIDNDGVAPQAAAPTQATVSVKDGLSRDEVIELFNTMMSQKSANVQEQPQVQPVTPVVEKPAPKVEEPVAEKPTPKVEEPVAEKPAPKVEEPVAEKPAPKVEEPVAEKPAKKTSVDEESTKSDVDGFFDIDVDAVDDLDLGDE